MLIRLLSQAAKGKTHENFQLLLQLHQSGTPSYMVLEDTGNTIRDQDFV